VHFTKLLQGESAIIMLDVEMYEKTRYNILARVIEARQYKRSI